MNYIKFKPTSILSLNKIKSLFLPKKIKKNPNKKIHGNQPKLSPIETQQPFESETHQHSKSMYPFCKSKGK